MSKNYYLAPLVIGLLGGAAACSHNGDREANAPANSGSDMSSGGSDGKDIKQLDALGGKDESGPPVSPASSDNSNSIRDNAIATAPERGGNEWMRTRSGDELANGASGPSAGRSGSMPGGGRSSAGAGSVGGNSSR